ncbi:MAG: transposase [Methylococcaceae bacterium]|jgi:REP element-mobilizing transposase RayT
MTYRPNSHHRKSIRLQGYDYSQAGMYFITLCTHDRLPLFGEIVEAEMILNNAGIEAEKCWCAIPEHFPSVTLNEFVIMPNHIHGIIAIAANYVGANNYLPLNDGTGSGAKDLLRLHSNKLQPLKHGTSRTIGSIVRGFKIGVTKWYRANTDVHDVWQRNYYEHIIRSEDSYLKIAEYIQNNPLQWQEDNYYISK